MKRPTHIRRFVLGFALGASGLSALAVGNLSLPFSFAPGQPIRSADVNANFDALRAALAQGPADGSVTAPKL
ncbi:hypothetical protein, partial [Deinococcus pimensis]|uniref:hypothetical protein n=1 Tax=Deinococcus pimensis TaxID=309888 RepID=UPI0005EADEB5